MLFLADTLSQIQNDELCTWFHDVEIPNQKLCRENVLKGRLCNSYSSVPTQSRYLDDKIFGKTSIIECHSNLLQHF